MDKDYTPNSHKYKEEQKNVSERPAVKKVIDGKAKVKKKSEIRKFADVFVAEDIGNVKDYIVGDVIVPLIKKTICDMFEDIPRMIFYGNTNKSRRSSGDRVSYADYSRNRDYRRDEPRTRNGLDYDEIRFDTRKDAEKVLRAMDEIMDTYGMVRVADMFDMVGEGETAPYTANDYGWLNIRNAEIIRVRDGYTIKMPRAIPIK